MSKVSDIYDAYISFTEAALSSYIRIPNPYDPEQNATLILNKGYGIGIGPADNTERLAKPKVSIARQFFVILVNQITATRQASSDRGTLEKALMEDAFTLISALEADDSLGGVAKITKFISDTGIDFLNNEREKYFSTELTFSTEYFETIT